MDGTYLHDDIDAMSVKCSRSHELFDLLEESSENERDLRMDFRYTGRSCTQDTALYAVFSKYDVEAIIIRLQEALDSNVTSLP